jgi:hypothetical protein
MGGPLNFPVVSAGGASQTVTTYTPNGVSPTLGAADANGMRSITNSGIGGLTLWDPDESLTISDDGSIFTFTTSVGAGQYPLEGISLSGWYTKGPILLMAAGTAASNGDYVQMTVEDIDPAGSCRAAVGWWLPNTEIATQWEGAGVSVYGGVAGNWGTPNARIATAFSRVLVASAGALVYPLQVRCEVEFTTSLPLTRRLIFLNAGSQFSDYDAMPGPAPGCYWGMAMARVITSTVEISEFKIAITS